MFEGKRTTGLSDSGEKLNKTVICVTFDVENTFGVLRLMLTVRSMFEKKKKKRTFFSSLQFFQSPGSSKLP